ncbi:MULTISPECIES: DUF6213 family protein [Streptomyces]|uniref:DUF6213 family protein n=2 Tax=Streptomyces TaxID=1883 RepID=A0ABU4KGE7_9ACTN|nr:DUF6213 family protein [Streptomyces roseolus]MDX2296802.1 DUF6213 family protein [Streptomyces roseolus]
MKVTTSFLRLPDGHLLLPADEVTELLRRLAALWIESAEAEDSELAPDTVAALVGALTEVADNIDAECIALMPAREDED